MDRQPILRQLVGRCDQLYDDNRTKMDIFGEDLLEMTNETRGEEQQRLR